MKIKKIFIKKHKKEKKLIDIGVEDDHTFYVSPRKNGNFYLTHNSYPDIDSDTSDRDVALKIINDYFGEENVIPVSNFNQLQLKSLIKDVGRLQGIPFEEINQYTRKIDSEALSEAKKEPGFDMQQWDLTYDEAQNNSLSFREFMLRYPDVNNVIKILFKQNRSLSRHAGGVVITNNAFNSMPVIKSGGVLQTPWPEGLNARHLEGFGFLKFDILGLGTLRMFENCIRRILKKKLNKEYISFEEIKDFYYQELHPDNNEMNDLKVYQNVYWDKNYAGIFQFVQKNVQEFMSNMKPTSIVDIAVATSIHRPGPLCLSGDSEVLIEKHKWESGQKHYSHKTIKQLYEEFNEPKKKSRYKYKLTSLNEETNKLFRNKIINVVKSGYKDVYAIKAKLNYSGYNVNFISSPKNKKTEINLKATLEHRFLTLDGWKKLKDIKVGEYIFYLNKNSSNGDVRKDSRTIGIMNERNFSNVAFKNYKYKCLFCTWQEGSLDVNHLEGNRKIDNTSQNLCFLCPNHHRMYTEGSITKEQCIYENEKNKLPYNEDIRMVHYLGCEYVGKEETYDLEVEGPNHNFIAGGFVVHNSIKADKLYLDNRRNAKNIVYKHPLLKDVLDSTCGLIIFQEQLQLIYHKLAGVPLEETDDIRKALLKKDKSNKEKTDKELKRLKLDFMDRCLEKNNISNELSEDIFDEMLKFIAYSFNKSHAVAYAIISYQCAHLLTYHPDEWLASYLDYCFNDKGRASGKEDPGAIALSEAKSMNYKIGKPDINYSTMEFEIKDRTIIPSFASMKSVGIAAYQEIKQYRNYKNIEDLVWNPDETWRHSKFNKKALSTLIKLEAFDSLNLVGENCLFKNYKQMHEVLVENGDFLKKANSKKKKDHKEILQNLISQVQDIEDWNLSEKISYNKELLGTVDNDLIVTPEIREYFRTTKIKSIDDWNNEKELYWAIVKSSKAATTKNGKSYCRVSLIGESSESYNCFFWNYVPAKDKLLPENIIIVGSFKKSDFGLSSFYGRIEVLEKR